MQNIYLQSIDKITDGSHCLSEKHAVNLANDTTMTYRKYAFTEHFMSEDDTFWL